MRLLVVGGSRFVGRHVVEAAVAAGHAVWLANRGVTTAETFGAEGHITIDREAGDLGGLRGIGFDAVVDVSAYVPRHVTQLHDELGQVERYLLVSSVSAYDHDAMATSTDEDTTALAAPVRDTETITPETYGGLKVACEEDAADRWGDAASIVRPGIVAGPHDHTDRFTWWVRHLAEDDEVALPDVRTDSVQVVDARDLAALCLALVVADGPAAVDATGDVLTVREMVDAVRDAIDGSGEVRWTPLDGWAPDAVPPLVQHPGDALAGIFDRRAPRGRAHGLVPRPLAETAAAVRAWDVERGLPPLTTDG